VASTNYGLGMSRGTSISESLLQEPAELTKLRWRAGTDPVLHPDAKRMLEAPRSQDLATANRELSAILRTQGASEFDGPGRVRPPPLKLNAPPSMRLPIIDTLSI